MIIGPDPEELQHNAKQKFPDMVGKGQVGQFKQIIPTQENIAVAVVKAAQGETAKAQLEHEAFLLNFLRENDFPAIQTYGNVFEVAPGRHALMMDYIENTTLLDGKSINNLRYSVPGMVLGIPVKTGDEAWAMQLPAIMRSIDKAASTCDLEQAKAFANTLGEQVAQLMKTVKEKMLMVGDLQILVDPKGKITIIDPLDVLRVVPKPNGQGVDFVDVVDPTKKNSALFVNSLFTSMDMLETVKNMCEEMGKATDNVELRNIVQTMMNPNPQLSLKNPLSVSAPPSPELGRRSNANDPRQSKSMPGSVSGTPSGSMRQTQNSQSRASDYQHRPPPIAPQAARRSTTPTPTARSTGTVPTRPSSTLPNTTDNSGGTKPKI